MDYGVWSGNFGFDPSTQFISAHVQICPVYQSLDFPVRALFFCFSANCPGRTASDFPLPRLIDERQTCPNFLMQLQLPPFASAVRRESFSESLLNPPNCQVTRGEFSRWPVSEIK